jgi:hypothetical protein
MKFLISTHSADLLLEGEDIPVEEIKEKYNEISEDDEVEAEYMLRDEYGFKRLDDCEAPPEDCIEWSP